MIVDSVDLVVLFDVVATIDFDDEQRFFAHLVREIDFVVRRFDLSRYCLNCWRY